MGAETKWIPLQHHELFGLGRGLDFLSCPRLNIYRKLGTNNILLFSPTRIPALKVKMMEAEEVVVWFSMAL